MTRYTPEFKHTILSLYATHIRGRSFESLARIHGIPGGRRTIHRWYHSWNGTAASLEPKQGQGRTRILTTTETYQHITRKIRTRNRTPRSINYAQVRSALIRKTNKQVSLRTVQRIGKQQLRIKAKTTKTRTIKECKLTPQTARKNSLNSTCTDCSRFCVFFCRVVVLSSTCDNIAALRRKLKRIDKNRVLFLDETALKLNQASRTTLVAPGETEYVIVDDTSSYAARYDMIACCNGSTVFPPVIYTPYERKHMGVKGIRTHMLIKYIQTCLAQACGALDLYPLYLVLDNSNIHNKAKMLEAFHDNGCQELVDIWFMPPSTAKRVSPLDNALFHEWKEHVRLRAPITKSNVEQLMADEWNNLSSKHINNYYKHCGLTTHHEPYFDCPQPSVHDHSSHRQSM
jgi:transposase-like protein